jgi:hypothetical protein
MQLHAVQLRAAGAANVTVISYSRAVTDHVRDCVAPWWTVSRLLPESFSVGPLVIADVDPPVFAQLASRATEGRGGNVTYINGRSVVRPLVDEGVTTAVVHDRGLAYRYEPELECLNVYGRDAEVGALARAAALFARESMRAALVQAGWSVLRASAVVRDGRAVLICGEDGSGKTSAALTLAARRGWELLGNDRVLVRADANGGVDVLPWPAPAAVGLGLLDELGWHSTVVRHLLAGEAPAATQDPRVTDALLVGERTALRLADGSELKAQLSLRQLTESFGLATATHARACGVLCTALRPAERPGVLAGERLIGAEDFRGRHEADRYPEVFLLAEDGRVQADEQVLRRLAELPHGAVSLGYATEANATTLDESASLFVPAPVAT